MLKNNEVVSVEMGRDLQGEEGGEVKLIKMWYVYVSAPQAECNQ